MGGEPIMKDLELFMAQMCHYAQGHVSNPDLDHIHIEYMMQCTSFQVACFLAQNTVEGTNGVEWEIVHKELCMPEKSVEEWQKIINSCAKDFGGWLKPTQHTTQKNTEPFKEINKVFKKAVQEFKEINMSDGISDSRVSDESIPSQLVQIRLGCDKKSEPLNTRIAIIEALCLDLYEQAKNDFEMEKVPLSLLIEHYGEQIGLAIDSICN